MLICITFFYSILLCDFNPNLLIPLLRQIWVILSFYEFLYVSPYTQEQGFPEGLYTTVEFLGLEFYFN